MNLQKMEMKKNVNVKECKYVNLMIENIIKINGGRRIKSNVSAKNFMYGKKNYT